jgi:hypothetical protein
MGTKMSLCGTNVEFKYRSIFRSRQSFWFTKEELDHLAKTPCAYSKAIAWSRGAKYGMLLEKY